MTFEEMERKDLINEMLLMLEIVIVSRNIAERIKADSRVIYYGTDSIYVIENAEVEREEKT